MPIFTDQIGNSIRLTETPKRIVSLVPSQTELLYDLGLESELVGITKFCIHPVQIFRSKKRVGGTKKLDFKAIRELQPDLIIANKEENEESQIRELMNEFPVWVSDIKNLDDALAMISEVGKITGKEEISLRLVKNISESFSKIQVSKQASAAYLIWNEPLMSINGDTFINYMMQRAGFVNVFEKRNERYPETNFEELYNLSPEFVLLSSEPFPFKEKHRDFFQEKFPMSKVLLVDGEMFSWYGSSLLKSAPYLQSLA